MSSCYDAWLAADQADLPLSTDWYESNIYICTKRRNCIKIGRKQVPLRTASVAIDQ